MKGLVGRAALVALVGTSVGSGAIAFGSRPSIAGASSSALTLQGQLTATDGLPRDFAGSAVAISGTTAVVGAPRRTRYRGGVYVFARTDARWVEQARLPIRERHYEAEFGYSVAISGDTIVVGDPYSFADGELDGAAYVYTRSGSSWVPAATLVSPDPQTGEGIYFGTSVAIAGSTILVGAPGRTLDGHLQAGGAYVFAPNGGGWVLQASLTGCDCTFGTAVALSATTAIVGGVGVGCCRKGIAFVFEHRAAGWVRAARLVPAVRKDGDGFGASVGISGRTAIVGAVLDQAAYVFTETERNVWTQSGELRAADTATGDRFGQSVAISGATAVVGAPVHGSARQGAVYVFKRSPAGWSPGSSLHVPLGGWGQFGISVAASGTTFVMGSPRLRDRPGTAYVYEAVTPA